VILEDLQCVDVIVPNKFYRIIKEVEVEEVEEVEEVVGWGPVVFLVNLMFLVFLPFQPSILPFGELPLGSLFISPPSSLPIISPSGMSS
jgi:hypothetical protein